MAAPGAHACKCSSGWFGRECAHKARDCSQLRSCNECQDAANRAFCGWCAVGHYCVPKHVHNALVKRDKACAAWYENTCPDHEPGNASRRGSGAQKPPGGWEESDEWLDSLELGDSSSVLLAEALQSWVEEAGKKGGGSWAVTLVLIAVVIVALRCFVHEFRAARERARFEEYMAEEKGAGRKSGGDEGAQWQRPEGARWSPGGGGGAHLFAHAGALVDAVGPTAALDGSSLSFAPAPCASCAVEHSPARGAAQALRAAEEAKLQEAIREAARLDLEERKEARRRQAAAAKGEAERAAVAAVAHGVSIRLQARVMQADGGSRPPPVDHKQMGQLAPSSTPAPKIVPAVEALPAAVEAVPAAVAALPAAAAVPPAARSKAAEAEFLAALDEL